MEKDYGLNFSGTFILRNNDECECGIKISDNDGFEYSNDFSGDMSDMTDFFYKDMVKAIMSHYLAKEKEEKEAARKVVKTSTPVNEQDDYVARLRTLEQRNRELEAQLKAVRDKDKTENNKQEDGSKRVKKVAPKHTSKRVRGDIFDDIFRDSFFRSFFDI